MIFEPFPQLHEDEMFCKLIEFVPCATRFGATWQTPGTTLGVVEH